MKRDILFKTTSLIFVLLLATVTSRAQQDVVHRLDGEDMLQQEIVGAVSTVDIEKMKRYPDLSLTNAMQGLSSGLIVRAGNGGLGNNIASLFVRGQSRLDGNGAIVVVDGIERSIDDLIAEEIETIEVLKDATAKVLYGARASNGVILVTTKRGHVGPRIIRTSFEYGVLVNTRVPKFLGAADYTQLYNEARENDGMAPRYSPAQLEGYKNSQGENDPYYPNVDWYNKFLLNQSIFSKAVVEFNGGNSSAKYALVAGYMGAQGIEAVGQRTATNQFNLRGNLDIRVSDLLTVKADVSGRMYVRNRSMRTATEIMSTLSSNKPNEYPLTIAPEFLGLAPSIDGVPYFGGSTRVNNNLLADLQYSGKVQDRYTRSQANLGLDFNLGKYLKGLTAQGYITLDNFGEANQMLQNTYSTYSLVPYVDPNGVDKVQITRLKTAQLGSTSHNIIGQSTSRKVGWWANIGYKNTFDQHSISAVVATRYTMYEHSGTTQDDKNWTHTLRLNYDYQKKYLAEIALGYMGSNVYSGADQYFLSPTGGLGWIVSREDFMADVGWVDFLKIKASAGILGYDGNGVYEMFSTRWRESGSRWQSGETNGTTNYPMDIITVGNPALKWERSKELNVGVEALLFSQKMKGEINYFVTARKDIIQVNSSLSTALGDYTWLDNIADVTNQGVDANLQWTDMLTGDLSYTAGVNFTYSLNRINKISEAANMDSFRSRIGKSTDAVITYRYAGLFGKDIDMTTHPYQTFGSYADGDIAYKDLNNDNIIDGRDQEQIGKLFPSTTWGISLELKYRGFGLYMLGTAETNVKKLVNSSYYRNIGEGRYSVLALDRYHPINNPQGTQPRLTTGTGSGNSYQTSEFWYSNSGFFRMKNVELSYTLEDKTSTAFYSSLKLFVRGTNLFVLSAIKDLDPERVMAGIDSYPSYRGFTGGVAITF